MSSSLALLLLLPSFVLALSKRSSHYYLSFTYQPATDLGEWLNVLTLCFAPLGAHLAFGVGKVVVLHHAANSASSAHREPGWMDRLTHFNPTSILWRYYAIVDRRIRAAKWTRTEMLLCNIVLWDGKNWDGRESVGNTRMYKISPEVGKKPAHVPLFSSSTVKTVIIALQGVQAVNNILFIIWPSKIHGSAFNGLGNMFVPLSLLGLMRLPAARWLEDDVKEIANMELISGDKNESDERFKPNTPLLGKVFRVFWALVVTAFVAIAWGSALVGFTRQPGSSVSGLLERLLYLVITGGLFVIHMIYLGKECKTGKTQLIIPCISEPWYKVYTIVLILIAVAGFIVQCLETRRITCGDECGSYTIGRYPEC